MVRRAERSSTTACQCIRCSIIDILGHDERDSGIVYASPAINGWKPAVGPRCDAFGERRADVQPTLEQLSVQHGQACSQRTAPNDDGSYPANVNNRTE